MYAAGLRPSPHLIGDWSARSGYEAGLEHGRRDGVTAVFCANDQMALGLLRALSEAGRSVPGDVSVVGFDDIPEAAYLIPPLTTVRQDFTAVGRRAIEILQAAIAGTRRARAADQPRARGARQHGRAHRKEPVMSEQDQYVVGVDYGTLSGRAVVVRVSDGAELGTATHEYAHAVSRTGCPAPASRCRPSGRCRCPTTTATCCAHAVPAAVAAAGIDPADVIGIATDFTACTMVPTLADGTPLNEVEGYADRPARLRQAVEAPRRPGPGRPDQPARRRPRRGLAAALRRADLLGVGVRQGPAAVRGGP